MSIIHSYQVVNCTCTYMCAVSLLMSRLYLIIIMCMWRSTPFLSVDVCVEPGGGLSTGAVVGIVVGAFVLLLFVGAVTGLLVWCLCCRDTPKKGTRCTCTCTQYWVVHCSAFSAMEDE